MAKRTQRQTTSSGGRAIPATTPGGPLAGRPEWSALGLLLLLVLAAYFNSLNGDFVFDNRAVILEDARVHEVSADGLRAIFTQDYWPKVATGVYRPFTTLSFLANYAVLKNGTRPLGYHVVNLVLHTLNAFLVFVLSRRLLQRSRLALAAAALFAVHAVGTEAVTNLVGRADLLATLAVLSALWAYRRSTEAQGGWRKVWLGASLSCVTLGMFCKETTIAVVALVPAYDFCFRARSSSEARETIRSWLRAPRVRTYLLFLLPVALFLLARGLALRGSSPASTGYVDNPLVGTDFLTAKLTAVGMLGDYLLLWLWPARLSCDYSFAQVPLFRLALGNPTFWTAVLAVFAIGAGGYAAWRSRTVQPAILFFCLWSLVAMAPTSNLLLTIGTIKAERLLYLPSVGLAVLSVMGLAAMGRRWWGDLGDRVEAGNESGRWAFAILVGAIVLALGMRTHRRNRDWQTDTSLWTATLQAAPLSYKPYVWMSSLVSYPGQETRQIDERLAYLEKAYAIVKEVPAPVHQHPRTFYQSLGDSYRLKGDSFARRSPDGALTPTEAGKPWYEKALTVLQQAERIDRAINEVKRAKRLRRGEKAEAIPDVGYDRIYMSLGDVLMRLTRYDEARTAFEYQRRLAPSSTDAHLRLATLAVTMGKADAAVPHLVRALVINPASASVWERLQRTHALSHVGCPDASKSADVKGLASRCPQFREQAATAYRELYAQVLEARQASNAAYVRQKAQLDLGLDLTKDR